MNAYDEIIADNCSSRSKILLNVLHYAVFGILLNLSRNRLLLFISVFHLLNPTMDDADLVDRYKRYKGGTTKIFDYIVATTRKLPEFMSVLPSLKKATKQAAKKTAKQAKKHSDGAPAADIQVTVTTSQLVKLAELIAKHAVSVPKSIFTLLTDVIKGRKVSSLSLIVRMLMRIKLISCRTAQRGMPR